MSHLYTIRIPVNVHGWEHDVEVRVRARHDGEAAEKIGRALTRLVNGGEDLPEEEVDG